MIQSIPKITVGKSNNVRKSLQDLSCDVSTSANFGLLQPLFVKEFEPNSNISVKCDNFVRLAPMHSPTFGRLSYRTYKSFVPVCDLWEPYEYFKSETPYTNGETSYVPSLVPCIKISDLSKILLFQKSVFSVYQKDAIYDDGSYDLNDAISYDNIEAWYSDNYSGSEMQEFCTFLQNQDIVNLAIGGLSGKFNDYIYYRSGSDSVSIEGADFLIEFSDYVFAFKLDYKGQQLYKNLIGCGFQVDFNNHDLISILPFIAFYKAYYDLFKVQRNSNWQNSNCAKYLRSVANNPLFANISDVDDEFRLRILNVFNEIGTTLYSIDPDFVSAHLRELSTDQPAKNISFIQEGISPDDYYSNVVFDDKRQNPRLETSDDTLSSLSRVGLQLLNKLAVRVNKNTAFGRRLDLILRNMFGARYHNQFKTNFLGSQITNCVISDVMSVADTANDGKGSLLGEYAGKGIGMSQDSKYDRFSSDTWGFLVVQSVIVPNGGFCQTLDPNLLHVRKYDFYQSDFDAVGFQATPACSVFGDGSCCVYDPITGNRPDMSKSFGFIPRYTEIKVSQNKINGLLALRSSRSSYLAYTLDRYLTPPDIIYASDLYDGSYISDSGVSNSLVAGDSWRYINSAGLTSNFNRIFYNSSEHDTSSIIPETDIIDNFIIHNYLDIKVNAPMLSISDSFDTDSFDSDSMDIEKA